MQYFLHDDQDNTYKLNEKGEIFGGPNHIEVPSGQWRAVRLRHVIRTTWQLNIIHILTTSDGWEIYKRHERFKNGRSQWRLVDFDYGAYRLWGARETLGRTTE